MSSKVISNTEIQIQCLMETHIELITPPLIIILVDNGCEGSSSNIFIPAKSELTSTLDTPLQKVFLYRLMLSSKT